MMMRLALPLVAAVTLAGCGGSGEQPPEEQIVVREPGEAAPAPAESAGSATDLVAAGKQAFAVCSACHAVTADAAPGIGPALYGVVGRAAGSFKGFDYSDALAGSGITWTDAELDAFIANPQGRMPGTSMSAGAVSDAGQRAAIIAYLGSLSE